MKVIQLPDVLHEYLVHVIEKHAGSGIHPEEGIAIANLWSAITKNATHIDDAEVRKMAAAASPAGQSTPQVSEEAQIAPRAGEEEFPDGFR